MKKLLIAENSGIFASSLHKALKDRYEIRISSDGPQTLELLQSFRPDILIINLMLPDIDGLTVLEQTPFRPKIVMAVTAYVCNYVVNSLAALGVDYTMIAPSVKALTSRLESLLRSYGDIPDLGDLPAMTAYHLRLLRFSQHLDGYRQLCVALPLFAQDPQQLLTKELYPKTAHLCGSKDARAVEHSIRKAIHAAWQHRDHAVWCKYFPPPPRGKICCPTNKAFICQLAEMLRSHTGPL